ncbi:MAG: cation transporter [Elusimicrobiota bacterium]
MNEKSQFWKERAIWLARFTIVYNLLEGFVSIGFGVKDEALSLAGFGADSFIEVASAFVVLWRLRRETGADSPLSLDAERRATHIIGWLFLALAAVAASAAVMRLVMRGAPDTTVPGLVISVLSLSFMFYLWSAKLRAGRALDSATIMKDAACSLACIQLSFVLFAGSLLYIALPALWWADAAAAILIAGFIAREGVGTVRAARRPDFKGGCGCCS